MKTWRRGDRNSGDPQGHEPVGEVCELVRLLMPRAVIGTDHVHSPRLEQIRS
jgi:hypothetical protein